MHRELDVRKEIQKRAYNGVGTTCVTADVAVPEKGLANLGQT